MSNEKILSLFVHEMSENVMDVLMRLLISPQTLEYAIKKEFTQEELRKYSFVAILRNAEYLSQDVIDFAINDLYQTLDKLYEEESL